MSTDALISVHLRLEWIENDMRGDLVPIACPDPGTVPQLYVAHHTHDDSFSRLTTHDVPE